MFVNENLKQHLETSSSINSQSLVIAEWNMNVAENISVIGNYRYRPTAVPADDDFIYANILNVFDINDCSNQVKFWCGATDADVTVDGGLDNANEPLAFTKPNEKEKLLYSLESCFERFRPRSGINKLRYFENGYTHFTNIDMANRPRYYMPSRNDAFKYWTSYREEGGAKRGIANKPVGDINYIDDAAPFIVYKNAVPANRVVLKMQTNVGSVDLGPFSNNGIAFTDPFYGEANKTVPSIWKIQILKDNNWTDIISFNQNSRRADGSPIIGDDGYLELMYGIVLPEQYSNIVIDGKYKFASLLPSDAAVNTAYFVQENDNELGEVYVWNGSSYDSFVPEYGWSLFSEEVSSQTNMVSQFVNPEYFIDGVTSSQRYKEFEYLDGIRVVVSAMNKQNSSFDLIELSPRLTANITDRVSGFNFNKSASDLGISGMPVGQLLASNGTLNIFDFDDSFNKNNNNSILSSFINKNLQIKLFEVISIAGDLIETYHVPLKTLYADGFPESANNSRQFSITLRDLFFYFETLNAPQILIQDASLSYAISMLFDSVGFTNYSFKRVDNESDPIIPYFFINPQTSIAQVLQDLALATQTAMFFDEYNNFILMSKNYMMPSEDERSTDAELLGTLDQGKSGVIENNSLNPKLSNIVEISSKNQEVYNDGIINFEEKYIARTFGSLRQASDVVNQDINWIYQNAMLWEVTGTPPIRPINSEETAGSYVLAAVPLNSDLSDEEPYVLNNEIQNNVIDFGEGAYWVARYNGYFYANGEIIKYDAIEYSVSEVGNVWISSVREYQNYFSKIRFGGKIYPTGRVRIFVEPDYEEINGVTLPKNGAVRKHGRAQFGTSIAYHYAGLSSYWSDTSVASPVRGVEMDSDYLFSTFADTSIQGVHNQVDIPLPVSIDIEDSSKIKAIVYANDQWVGVGTDGKFRKSTDGLTWETVVDDNIAGAFTLNSIAYGRGPLEDEEEMTYKYLWIAAGYKLNGETKVNALISSEDAETWVEIEDHGLGNGQLQKIVNYNDTWAVAGTNAMFATSSDGLTWEEKTLSLDYTVSTSKAKILSRTYQQTGIKVSIAQGTPAIFTLKNHGLQENDRIRLSTTGTLPSGLNTTTDYYVNRKSANTFAVKEEAEGAPQNATTSGSGTHTYKKLAATFKIVRHGLATNDRIRVIPSGTLPTNIEEDVVYKVRVIDADNVHLTAAGESALVAYSSAQSTSSHKIERFVRNRINSIDYANSKWVVVGDDGCVAYSSDTNTWTPVNAGFGTSDIFDISNRLGVFVAGGESGKAFTSSNLSQWTALSTKLKTRINTVKSGGNTWILAGAGGKAVRATMNGLSSYSAWKAVDLKFGTSDIYQVDFLAGSPNLWLAVGNKLKLSNSKDSLTWTDSSQENIGELKFTTTVNHQFVPLDVVKFTTTGTLPEDAGTAIQSITLANPAVFNVKNHKLSNNDQIKLAIVTEGGELPGNLSTDTTYYVSVVNSGSFKVRLSPGGSFVSTAGNTSSGSFKFYRPPLETEREYYVTSKNISSNTFTVADSKLNARAGITVKSRGSQVSEHTVEFYTDVLESDLVYISNIYAEESTNVLIVNTESAHGLEVGDRVYFGVRKDDGSFSEKSISGGIIRYAQYYVNTVIDASNIKISESDNTEPIEYFDNAAVIAINERFCIVPNAIPEILKSTLIVPGNISVRPGNLIEKANGSGSLVSPTRVSSTRTSRKISKVVEISIGDPAIISCTNHGLFDGDSISFSTTKTLPYGIETNLQYFVEKINDDSFKIYSLNKDNEVEFIVTKEGEVPDTISDTYREASGTHSFIKSVNDQNRITLTREVSQVIPKFKITTETTVNEETNKEETITSYEDVAYKNIIDVIQELDVTETEPAGYSASNNSLARSASRNGIIKNHFTKSSFSETDINKFLSTKTGTVQSSALVFNGPSFDFENNNNSPKPINFVSYVYKDLSSSENKFSHFGTRMRIIGSLGEDSNSQNVYPSQEYFSNPKHAINEPPTISGGSAGLAIMVNPETNVGYYFEIIALAQNNIDKYADEVGLFNVAFYKVVRKVPNEGEPFVSDSSKAIPIKLWQGITSITVDDGTLVGQFRMVNEENPSVYDISVEYENIAGDNLRRFYLMINNIVVAVVDDTSPLPVRNNMALFVRGSTRAMFENIYAVANNYTQNTVFELDAPVNSVFGTEKVNVSESFRKYALTGAINSTYLSGISPNDSSQYNIYFEEFGTIMRECAYFNIRYDKAYPALYARIADVPNKMKGYTVSGFIPDAYGAEFLVFNNTDTAINLDDTSGNYLRIQGVSFTSAAQKELTVDDYFERISNFSDPETNDDGTIVSPLRSKKDYLDIKNSRTTYGRKEFNITSPYIQNQDEANNLMEWIISKIMKPRLSVGAKVFGMPIIQLGDIVSIDYETQDGVKQISNNNSRFVVYNIEYSRDSSGPSTNIYMSEVL
jgi:hypothetical protein